MIFGHKPKQFIHCKRGNIEQVNYILRSNRNIQEDIVEMIDNSRKPKPVRSIMGGQVFNTPRIILNGVKIQN